MLEVKVIKHIALLLPLFVSSTNHWGVGEQGQKASEPTLLNGIDVSIH
jgi:hypothetical protein